METTKKGTFHNPRNKLKMKGLSPHRLGSLRPVTSEVASSSPVVPATFFNHLASLPLSDFRPVFASATAAPHPPSITASQAWPKPAHQSYASVLEGLFAVVEEFLLQIRPELGHQVAHDAAGEAGVEPAEHHRSAPADRGVIQIGRRDSHRRAKDPGGVECGSTGILARNHDAAHGINNALEHTGSRPLAIVARILMQIGRASGREKGYI